VITENESVVKIAVIKIIMFITIIIISISTRTRSSNSVSTRSSSSSSKQNPYPESASELHRLRDCCLSEKLVPTFSARHVSLSQRGGSPTAVISGFCTERINGSTWSASRDFLDRSRYFFFQVAPQLYPRG
jgi:hypothetical protein